MDDFERYAQDIPFPAYAFVPGRHPHPIRDPAGHSFGNAEEPTGTITRKELTDDTDFRFGLDLFNFGYYWEAHEAWEGLWHAAGRKGQLADLLKGLIHLAAAGVKAREGNPNGVARHALRAGELFVGANCDRLAKVAGEIHANPPCDDRPTDIGFPVLCVSITLEDFPVS